MGNQNISNEAIVKGSHKAISQHTIQKISEQMNCICQFEIGNNKGSGFLCKLLNKKKNMPLPVFITSNHLLKNEIIKACNKIEFKVNKKKYYLILDNSRVIYTSQSQHNDISIIEIRKEDHINKKYFLDIDENIYNEGIKEYYREKDIYILHNEKGEKIKFSQGIVKGIKSTGLIGEYYIYHSCSTDKGSSGGPLFNSSNMKVFGIHKGSDDKYSLNLGILIKDPIQKYYDKYKSKRGLMKSQLNNNDNFFKDEGSEIEEDNEVEKEEEYKREEKRAEEDDDGFEEYIDDPKNIEEKEEYNQINDLNHDIAVATPNENQQIHDHPFNKYANINGKCDICAQKIKNWCYKCDYCGIILCLDCRFNIFYKQKNNSLHNHILKLVKRYNWSCQKCGSSEQWISFYCLLCNYDLCYYCYLGEKKEQKTQLLVNDNLRNKDLEEKKEQKNQILINDNLIKKDEEEQIKSLFVENNSEKKNEQKMPLILYDESIHDHRFDYNNELYIKCKSCANYIIEEPGYECQNCEIDLCLDCADKIFIQKKKYNHKHHLKLESKDNWFCDICNNKYDFKNAPFQCKICDLDVCYKCYLK